MTMELKEAIFKRCLEQTPKLPGLNGDLGLRSWWVSWIAIFLVELAQGGPKNQ